MASGRFSIGPSTWLPSMGSCEIDYDSKGEFKAIKADGKNDSRETWLGRHNAIITVKLSWRDDTRPDSDVDGPIDTRVVNFLADISPRGPNGGKAFAWVENDQRIHNVYDITVEQLTSKRVPGSGKGDATIKLFSWIKPAATSPIVTKTPDKASPWAPGATTKQQPPGAPKKGFTQPGSEVKVNP